MYVAMYSGYSIPALSLGLIEVHTSFTIAFVIVTAGLAIVTAVLPLLRAPRDRNLVRERDLAARAA
jgi:hypothetical protein